MTEEQKRQAEKLSQEIERDSKVNQEKRKYMTKEMLGGENEDEEMLHSSVIRESAYIHRNNKTQKPELTQTLMDALGASPTLINKT